MAIHPTGFHPPSRLLCLTAVPWEPRAVLTIACALVLAFVPAAVGAKAISPSAVSRLTVPARIKSGKTVRFGVRYSCAARPRSGRLATGQAGVAGREPLPVLVAARAGPPRDLEVGRARTVPALAPGDYVRGHDRHAEALREDDLDRAQQTTRPRHASGLGEPAPSSPRPNSRFMRSAATAPTTEPAFTESEAWVRCPSSASPPCSSPSRRSCASRRPA